MAAQNLNRSSRLRHSLRIFAHDLYKVKTALNHCSAILERTKSTDEIETIKPKLIEENIWNDGVKEEV
jgi:hypothetical protein